MVTYTNMDNHRVDTQCRLGWNTCSCTDDVQVLTGTRKFEVTSPVHRCIDLLSTTVYDLTPKYTITKIHFGEQLHTKSTKEVGAISQPV